MPSVKGTLRKMNTAHTPETGIVNYTLNLDNQGVLELNSLVGQKIHLTFSGKIFCVACGRSITKTFNSGYCYPCFSTLAECDICIVKPEKCHFHLGTCRQPDWGTSHCFQDHTLYLARSSSIKVGITRTIQQVHRWMDQGAIEAKEIGFFPDRYQVGLAEASISQKMEDKTNWRKMLKNEVTDEPFEGYLETILNTLSEAQAKLLVSDGRTYSFTYPVQVYPKKITSKKFDKLPEFTSILQGIKGQYLIFDSHVMNLRSQAGYEITLNY